ncbi:MAG TPA: prepilin-type N-terminal cleavage/methylation domain-containing protein [Rhizomicrobium sp.]|nr:prepilin-type N-terminal cleavage/methylation domain-containing protein [Rhizomicrobium sp.]
MRRQAGFTLIELLVSLTLLGLLFVLLLGGLRFGTRAWERGTTTADASDTVRQVQDLLRNEVERACPRQIPPATPQDIPRVDFTGDAGQMRFWAPAPGAAGGRACVRLALAVRPDGHLQRLVLVFGPDVNADGTDLLRGAEAMDLAYLPAGGGAWQTGWRGAAELPALVRLRIAFPRGDARLWPELFMAPRISAEADCTYDPATKSCRGN